jgi:hypothetical protein
MSSDRWSMSSMMAATCPWRVVSATAATASSTEAKNAPSVATSPTTSGCSLRVHSTMMPRVPSEPIMRAQRS